MTKGETMSTMIELAQRMLRGQAPPPPIGRLIGFALKAVKQGHAVFEMEVDERHHNPMGTLHGGVYCDLADAAMGIAYAATLGEGESFTTVELKINFLRAVRILCDIASLLSVQRSANGAPCDWQLGIFSVAIS
jgi:uncharacterized protein (TIGR00369 family)